MKRQRFRDIRTDKCLTFSTAFVINIQTVRPKKKTATERWRGTDSVVESFNFQV